MDDIVKITKLLELFKAEGYNVSTEEMAVAIVYELQPSFSKQITRIDLPDVEYKGTNLTREDKIRFSTQIAEIEKLMSDGQYRDYVQIQNVLPHISQESIGRHLRYLGESNRWVKEIRKVGSHSSHRLVNCT